MAKIVKRLGNTIDITLVVKDSNGAVVNLNSKFGVSAAGKNAKYDISIIKSFGRTYQVPLSDVTEKEITSGKLVFKWKASQQYGVGDYTILLRLYNTTTSTVNGATVYTSELDSSVDLSQAIKLTQYTCQGTSKENSVTINFNI